jgi:hypothetical protein
MKRIKVNYYHDAYQYREPEIYRVTDFDKLLLKVRNRLEIDMMHSFVTGGTFWASFAKPIGDRWIETDELFKQRIRVEKQVYHISE